jgi:hypothetical protein
MKSGSENRVVFHNRGEIEQLCERSVNDVMGEEIKYCRNMLLQKL